MDRATLARKLVETAYLEGDFVLSSGRHSNYYFDKYLFETQPDVLGPVADHMAALLPEGTQKVAGPELGGVALATAVSLRVGLPFVIVRREEKAYGTTRAVEGTLAPGDKVALLEDVLTTGAQALRAARTLQRAGADVIAIIGVVDREEGARETIEAAGQRLLALFTRTELDALRTVG